MLCICKSVQSIVEENELYRSIVCFMIIGLKENVPCIIKALPVTNINSEWLKDEPLSCLDILMKAGFRVRATVCDNHATNGSTYSKLLKLHDQDTQSLFINFQSQKVYLFFNTVHLIKNVRNNLLNRKRFIFPEFNFCDFFDNITVNSVEISWRLLHNVHEIIKIWVQI